MAEYSTFRTALNGFHRADVTNYIESLCEEHRAALRKLQLEADELRQECDSLRAQLEAAQAENRDLNVQLDLMQSILDEATAPAPEPEPAPLPKPESIPEPEPAEDVPDYTRLELEAYRRAEATERLASERAAQLRKQLSEHLTLTTTRYEETGAEIRVLTADLNTNLQRLEEALAELDTVFDTAVDGLDDLRSEHDSYSD